MTRPEPATAEMIAREIVNTWLMEHSGSALEHVTLKGQVSLEGAIRSAITAAESRAMERCAKIAAALIVRVNVTGPHDDYAQGKKDAAAEIYQTILAIRSSINPPGEEE